MANHIPANCYPVVELNDPAGKVLVDQFIDLDLLDDRTAEEDYLEAANNWSLNNPRTIQVSAFDDNGDFITPAPENSILMQDLPLSPVLDENGDVLPIPEGYRQIIDRAAFLPLGYPAPNDYIEDSEALVYYKILYQAIPSPHNTYYLQTLSVYPPISEYPLQPATQAQIDAYNAQEDARIAQEILQNGRQERLAELNAFSKQLLNNGVILNIMPFNESVSTHAIKIPSTMTLLTENLDLAHGLKSKTFAFPSLNKKVYFENIPQSCIEKLIDDIAFSKISIKRRILLAADQIQAAQSIEEINAITLNLDNLVPADTNFGVVDNVINYNMTEDIVENITISKIEHGAEIPLPIVNADGRPNSPNIDTLTSLLAYA